MADRKSAEGNELFSDEESLREEEQQQVEDYVECAMGTIYKVAQDAANLEMEIHHCTQQDFRKLDEMLIQLIIKLDSLDPKGNEKIKEERKRVIKYVQECMKLLDMRTGRYDANEDEI